jgi:hypothetical protein
MPRAHSKNQRKQPRLTNVGIAFTIWLREPIGHCCNSSSVRAKAIHLLWQPRRRSEILKVAVRGVSEIDITIARVDRDVVERIELPAKKVVEDD